MKKLSVLLVGTANSGKSTLFYSLTHKKVDIGNRAGVTVSEKEGKIKGDTKNVSLNLVDLPGIYSLAPHTKDEFLTVKRLEEANADIILNVLDVTSLEGGLALTLELRRRFPDTPVVLALNMTDELRAKKLSVDEEKLSKLLGVFAISISAIKGEGLDRLKETLIKADGLRTPCRYFGSVSSLALSVLKKRNGERLSQREYRESMLSGDRITDRLDRILLSRSLGIPIFWRSSHSFFLSRSERSALPCRTR